MNAERVRDPGEFNESQYILTGNSQPVSEVAQELSTFIDRGEQGSKEREQIAVRAFEALTKLTVNEADRVVHELDIQRALGAEVGIRNKSKSIIYDVIPFNIQGIFGNPEMTKEVTDKQLINCFLISNEMIVSVDDQPLKERYSFIGQIHK